MRAPNHPALIDSLSLIMLANWPGKILVVSRLRIYLVSQVLDLGWDLLQFLHRAAPDRARGPGPDIPEPPQGAPHNACR